MKKFFYTILAFAAVVACSKEKEAPVKEDGPVEGGAYELSINAYVDEGNLTKTSYAADGAFSWVQKDTIRVRIKNTVDEKVSLCNMYAKSSGASTEFSVTLSADNYRPDSIAVYTPYKTAMSNTIYDGSSVRVSMPLSYHLDGANKAGMTYYNKVSFSSANPLSVLPLVGVQQQDGSFKFQTAVGVLHVQLTGLEDKAAGICINSAGGDISNYLMVRDGAISMGNAWYDTSGSTPSKYAANFVYYFFKQTAEHTASVYVPIPVGTLVAGSSIEVVDASGLTLFTKEFKKDVQIERNKVVELAPFKGSEDWESIGAAQFTDAVAWEIAGYTAGSYIQVNAYSSGNLIKIDSPYAAAANVTGYTPEGKVTPATESIILTVENDGKVYYNTFTTGIYVSSSWTSLQLTHPYYYSSNYPSYYASFGYGDNFVAKLDAEGKPANIVLSPVYNAAESSYWYGEQYIHARPIQLVMPGASKVDPTITVVFKGITDPTPAQAVASVDLTIGDIYSGASLVIAASQADAEAAFSAGTGIVEATASGTYSVNMPAAAPSGEYYVFAKPQGAATEAAGAIAVSAVFKYQSVADWASIGTGSYYDYYVWNSLSFGDEFVDVEILKNAEGKYLLDPYKAAYTKYSYNPEGSVTGPRELLLTIDANGLVSYDETATGYYNSSWGAEIGLTHPYYYSSNYPQYYASFGKGNNFVVKKNADGTPANIILSPVYSSMTTSTWTGDNFIWSNPIQIVFPGSTPVDIDAEVAFVEVQDDSSAQPLIGVSAYVGSDIAELQIVIAASEADAAAAFAAGTLVTTAAATGNYTVSMAPDSPSGDYVVFAKVVAAEGIEPVANRTISSAPFRYDNPDADLGLAEDVVFGDWTGSITHNQSGSYKSATFTMSLGESDSPLEGNVLITKLMGYTGNGKGYMYFDTATGSLTIPDETPCAIRGSYQMGLADANNVGNGYLIFRYLPATDQITLENMEFVYFGAYDDSGTWLGHWGYFYGPLENNYHLLLSRVSSGSSAPAKKANLVEIAPIKGRPAVARQRK